MSDAIIIAIISGLVSITGVVISAMIKYKQEQLHKLINSRMDELLALARKEGKDEGKAEEKANQSL